MRWSHPLNVIEIDFMFKHLKIGKRLAIGFAVLVLLIVVTGAFSAQRMGVAQDVVVEISGQLRASAGTVHLNGRDLTPLAAPARMHAGLGRAFQLTQLFPRLSVHENVRLALQSRQQGMSWRQIRFWRTWNDDRDLIARADALLERTRLSARRDQSAADLRYLKSLLD